MTPMFELINYVISSLVGKSVCSMMVIISVLE